MGDYRRTSGEELPATPSEARHKRRRFFLVLLLVVALIGVAGWMVRIPRYTLATGYVTTQEYAEVRSPVTGIVQKILVRSGEQVEAGQVLVELNSSEEEALLSESRARVSKLRTEMERRQAEMAIDLERRSVELSEEKRRHNDQLKIADLELRNATSKLELTRQLVANGLKAASHLEDDQLKERLAQVRLASLKERDFRIYEELLTRDREKYDREIQALRNELSALEESVHRMEARLELRKIRAPVAGQVVRYEFVVGELLQPTSVIYEIFGGELNELKLRVDERYATRIAPGQPYRARLASFRNGLTRRYFRGEVQALRNVIQSENRSTYRVAYCSFDAGGENVPPGTTAEARIYYATSNFWMFLFNIDP